MKILLLFFFTTFFATAQNIDFEKVGVKPAKYDVFWGNDIYGNNYFSTSNNLYKINEKDTLNYTNNKYGKITGVETFNMLQTVVFYKQNNAFVLLDAQFNEINSTIFSEINCEFLKPASQNELWFYDSLSQQIGLYNLNSKNYKFLSNPINKAIKYAYSDYNYLFWIDVENGIYSINKFGKIASLGKVKPFEKVIFSDKSDLFYLFDDKMYYYSVQNQASMKIDIDEKMIKNFFYKDGILSIFTDCQISTYQIKK
ncbi:hypothetical protein [Flavobacterium terrigena]|nr:hypothetical protein [Flavobacterium terrigena]